MQLCRIKSIQITLKNSKYHYIFWWQKFDDSETNHESVYEQNQFEKREARKNRLVPFWDERWLHQCQKDYKASCELKLIAVLFALPRARCTRLYGWNRERKREGCEFLGRKRALGRIDRCKDEKCRAKRYESRRAWKKEAERNNISVMRMRDVLRLKRKLSWRTLQETIKSLKDTRM